MEVVKIKIDGEFIRLDALMKLASMVNQGGEAKHLIQGGEVLLNNHICFERSKKLRPGDIVEYGGIKAIVE